MTKLVEGQKVIVHVPGAEDAARHSIHLIDDKKPVYGHVVYVHESGNVNVVVYDHAGSSIALSDVVTTKPKDEKEIYVSASK